MKVNYKEFSKNIRLLALEMIHKSNSSHIGGAFSMADILAVLYGHVLKVFPEQPNHNGRDRFFLSKGHACASLYATLALKGFFDKELLKEYSKDGSILLSHAHNKVPGVELSTGSLGHALPVACGVAIGLRKNANSAKCYVILSDGELDEGSNWEAIMFGAHHKLSNLTVIIDNNRIQSLGFKKDILNIENLYERLASFGWEVMEVDGHAFYELEYSLTLASDKPKIIIANTIKGKGVDFMENELLWHYKPPNLEQYYEAVAQIKNS